MEQKRYFASGTVALGSEHTSFSFVGSLSIKFLVTPFLRQSNLPLFAPFLCKAGTWTLPLFLCHAQKAKRVDRKYAFATLTLKKEIILSGLFHSQFFGFVLHFYHFLRFLTAKAGRSFSASAVQPVSRKKLQKRTRARQVAKRPLSFF